jgi:hypothetical protein
MKIGGIPEYFNKILQSNNIASFSFNKPEKLHRLNPSL